MLQQYISTVSLFVALLSAGASCFANDLSPEEIEARDFSYKSVGIGTSLERFKKDFPNIKIYTNKNGPETASCAIRPTKTRAVIVEFFRGRAYNLKVTIHSDEVARIGGAKVIVEKLKRKFGSSDDTFEDGDLNWYFPRIYRDVYFTTEEPEFAMISVTDMKAHTQLQVVKRWPKN